MKTLVFASNNAHKLEEIRSILSDSYARAEPCLRPTPQLTATPDS